MTRYSIEGMDGVSAQWRAALEQVSGAMLTAARTPATLAHTRPYDPLALFRTMAEFATAVRPEQLLDVQLKAAREWGEFWANAWSPKPAAEKPRDRRFAHAEWDEQPYFRTIRDAYLLASQQLRGAVAAADAKGTNAAMMGFLVDQYLNAVAPTNFAMTNPEVVERTLATGGANLAAGFANLVEDVAAGKGIVKRRTASDFVVGETLATTPGSVVFENHLFQLIQYDPATPEVAAEPLLYVPPLVNKFYMIDLQPKSSLVKWLVDQGRTVFVVSWVNPDAAQRDCGVEQYVLDGVATAIGAARQAAGADKVDLFSFCLGGTLVAITLAYLTAKGRADEVNTATLIGSMVDFADMRDWSAFVHEAHLDALEDHLAKRGFIDSTELQQLFAAVRSNDLIWSSVVNHYLLDKPAPASDLLHWFEDGARIPQAFLKSYNRGLLAQNALTGTGFQAGGVAIDLSRVKTPLTVIALKDDHVSAWEAVYDGTRLFGGPVTYILGGSGHNAGVINPPAANKHGYWTNDAHPATGQEWLDSATRHEGSWWPAWDAWLTEHGTGMVKARKPQDAIEAAPRTIREGRLLMSQISDDTLTYVDGRAGRLRLNRPRALHALNLAMVQQMTGALLEWRSDPLVRLIMIDHGEGRGFCAGGDVVSIASSALGHGAAGRAFFFQEYRLNHLMYTYPKPGVVFMDGITMGGGVGIACPCRYRVATERTVFAMPETTIGLFPDVGGGRYLSRLRGRVAQWLALTGARIDGADCVALGLANFYVPSERLDALKAELCAAPEKVESLLAGAAVAPPPAAVAEVLPLIDRLFASDEYEDILAALETDGGDWARAQLATLAGKSPTACKVSLRMLVESPRQPHFLDEMKMEYGIVARMFRHGDFYEGVRALLVDKDNAPRWDPATAAGVTPAMVDAFFEPLPPREAWTPLGADGD